jgi:hypothetical protein
MTTASRFISRWAVGDTIDSLTILSLYDVPEGEAKPKSCTVLCSDCGQTSEMRTDAIHTRHFRNRVKTSCKACNFKVDNEKRSKARTKIKLDEDIIEVDTLPIFTKRNKTFDAKKYQISKIATKFSFMLSAYFSRSNASYLIISTS